MTLRDLVLRLYSVENVRDNGDGEVAINCPFCVEEVGKKDFKFRLGINTTTGVGHCFRCEFKGGRNKVFRELCRVFGVQYTLDRVDDVPITPTKEDTVVKKKKPQATTMPVEFEPLWKNVDDAIGKKALKYLLNRNVTRVQIEKHRIGFCAVGKYAHRIIFPVLYKKQLVGIVARDFSGKAEYKYLNSIGDKSMYNVPRKISKIANLGEGCFDALSLERGVNSSEDCLAALGSKLSKPQLKILLRYETIVIWPDPDRPGVEGAVKKATQLLKRKKQVLVVPPDSDIDTDADLGGLLSSEVREKRNCAVPFTKAIAAKMRLHVSMSAPFKKKRTFSKFVK